MGTRHFQKTVNIGHNKDMWNFLKYHYTYDTLNSWNRMVSVSNNVKAYNLPFDHDYREVMDVLQKDDYETINEYIDEWEDDHSGYKIGFNGRSQGYIVLYNEKDSKNILPSFITDYDSYEDFKESNYVSSYTSDLRAYTELVRDFDRLCDELIDICDDLVEEYEEMEESNNENR